MHECVASSVRDGSHELSGTLYVGGTVVVMNSSDRSINPCIPLPAGLLGVGRLLLLPLLDSQLTSLHVIE